MSERFWDYSLAVYGRPGFAEAGLGLQARLGADINMLLLCCWHATSGRGELAGEELLRLIARVRDWRETVIEPLRAMRRSLKAHPLPDAQELRDRIEACELEAERIEQSMLEEEVSGPSPADRSPAGGREAAAGSIGTYLSLLGIGAAEPDRADIDRLLDAAFPA